MMKEVEDQSQIYISLLKNISFNLGSRWLLILLQ